MISGTLYIFGSHSTALEIAEAALANSTTFNSAKFVVPEKEYSDRDLQIPISDIATIKFSAHCGYILSMANQRVRRSCLSIAKSNGLTPSTVIHPTALISKTAQIGEGVYVGAHSIISVNAKIADHAMINFQVSVGHDASIESHATVNPGAKISGNCSIGARTLLGANSFVHQGRRVGEDCQVDALTHIDRDIADGMLCTSRNLKIVKRPFIQ
ncbi:DapH/DapD/GlmU-related protein [Crateriforma conspicua]|uniref:DapH/DapD/GlmU-related protein n=1 Tax=Crateriforma conspicua TaxID=2527996 RepID=UPI00119CE9A9|nr:DapH/DapD/GlmU-related protein [Crateriforma conspicua]